MKRHEIADILITVYPKAYSGEIGIAPRGDGRECWRLVFPQFSGPDAEELFYPVGHEAKDRETLIDLASHYATAYLIGAGRTLQ